MGETNGHEASNGWFIIEMTMTRDDWVKCYDRKSPGLHPDNTKKLMKEIACRILRARKNSRKPDYEQGEAEIPGRGQPGESIHRKLTSETQFFPNPELSSETSYIPFLTFGAVAVGFLGISFLARQLFRRWKAKSRPAPAPTSDATDEVCV